LSAVIIISESSLSWEFLSTLGYSFAVTQVGIIVAEQVGYGYPTKTDHTDSCGILP
jgi:hypothetical protein